MTQNDQKTADAFADSWNNLPAGSVYTKEQFEDWFAPLKKVDIENKSVLELGCGNASLLVHLANWNPLRITGIDLGTSVDTAERNMSKLNFKNWRIIKGDLVKYRSDEGYDLVFSIGVLHHLQHPESGFESVLRNVKPGGRFHCWVYAREGNWVIINIVDRIRKIASKLPWWLTKYFIVIPLVIPYYLYAKTIKIMPPSAFLKKMPLYNYSLWIAEREFGFFRHVAFDQLVTPQTAYIGRSMIEGWLEKYKNRIKKDSIYIIFRNGNSWKFGGRKKSE